MQKIIIADNNLKIGGVQKALVNLLHEISDRYSITLVLFEHDGEYLKEIPPNVKVISAHKLCRILGLSQRETREKCRAIAWIRTVCVAYTKLFGNGFPINCVVGKKIKHTGYDFAISFMHFAPKTQFYGGTNEYILNCTEAKKKLTFLHCDYKNYGGNTAYTRKQYQRFDRIALCSQGCADIFKNTLPEVANKVFVVRNCNRFNEIKNLADMQPLVYSTDKIHLINVARLSKEKGIERSLRVVARLKNDGIPISYHLLGDGPERESLQSLVRLLGITDEVIFHGQQENPYRYMKNADLFLLTSYHEAAPMVLDEARCLALPVLSTKTSSSYEMIEKEDAGWVCENNEESIYLTLLELLQTPSIIRQKKEHLRISTCDNTSALQQFYKFMDGII